MADVITYVGAGVSSTTDGASAPTPALPAGLTDDDLMLAFFYSREVIDGTVSISAGWTPLVNERTAGGLLAIWYRLYVAADLAPTFTLGNHALNDTCLAQIAAWRGVDTANPVDSVGTMADNAAAVDIGPVPGINLNRKALVVAFGGKLDDYTSVAVLSGDNLSWNEIGEVFSTLGTDAGMIWDYAISEELELVLSNYIFDVVGGSSVAGKGLLISFNLEPDAYAAATDAVLYCAESHPITDSGTPGGAIDPLMRAMFTDLAANDDVEAVSSDAADTDMSAIIKGRDSTGALVEEIKQMNGTTAIIFSVMGLIDDMLEFRLTEPAVGDVTVRRSVGGTTIGVIPAGELGFRRLFYGAYSHPNDAKTYYEKIFVKNIHPLITLSNVSVVENADPGALLTFTLASSLDDVAFATNRLTAPGIADTAPDTFDASEKFLPSPSNLDPGQACGIWVKLSVPAAQVATKNTYTLQVAGDVP